PETAVPLDNRRNDRRAIHGQDQLARRRGFPRRFVARLQLLGRRRSRYAGRLRGDRPVAGLETLEPALFGELAALFLAARLLFVRQIRVVVAPEVGDAEAELVLRVDREGEGAVHGAAQGV